MTTLSAGHRVAHIPELLEQILLHVFENFWTYDHFISDIEMKTVLASQRVSITFHNTITGSSKLQQALLLTAPAEAATFTDQHCWNPISKNFLYYAGCWSPPYTPHSVCEGRSRFEVYVRDLQKNSIKQSWRKMYLCAESYDVVVLQDFEDGWRKDAPMRNVTFGQVYDRAMVLEQAEMAKKTKDGEADGLWQQDARVRELAQEIEAGSTQIELPLLMAETEVVAKDEVILQS